MPYSHDRYERQRRQNYGASSQRSALGYWLPLAFTVTAATIGLAVWIWNERRDDDPASDNYDRRRGADHPSQDPQRPQENLNGTKSEQTPYAPREREDQSHHVEDEGLMARMSGALRRTPSPQQVLEGASRRVAAGMAAASAMVGGALSSIREEDKRDFEDHSRWSEEAESRIEDSKTQNRAGQLERPDAQTSVADASLSSRPSQSSQSKNTGKRKTVAIVVSADSDYHHQHETASHHEIHASLLSHLPRYVDAASRVFVLIYAPDLKQHPLDTRIQGAAQQPASMNSSYSNIGHEDAQTRGEESEKRLATVDPEQLSSAFRSDMFNRLYSQAQALVNMDTAIMPFTTTQGHLHILRHLSPDVVYLQETLAGPEGDVINSLSNWVGQTVLVVGDESGHGGLVDSEDEHGNLGNQTTSKWWQDDPRIGLGKGVEVVDGLRVGEDWRRRVGGHD